MFKYFKHKDINIKLWDECIEKASNGLIYALSWYLDIVSPGWDGIIKEENGKYIAVFPLTIFKKFSITYLRTPHFCQQLGLFSIRKITEEEVKEVSSLLTKYFPLVSYYSLNIDNEFGIVERQFSISESKTYHLPLREPYEKIFKNFKKDKKEKIKRAKRRGVTVGESEDIKELIALFEQNVSFKIEGGVRKEQYMLLHQLYKECLKRKLGFLLTAHSPNNDILSIAFFYKFKNLIIYFFSATTLEGRKNNGIEAILDYVIRKYSNSCCILDFEGSDVKNIEEFYARFGGQLIKYQKLYRNELNLVFKIIKSTRQEGIKLFKRIF